jgi:hypothetical protein
MNKSLITEKTFKKVYLLGSIEFLACFIIVFCFLPAEFCVRTSGHYGMFCDLLFSRVQKEWGQLVRPPALLDVHHKKYNFSCKN